MAAIAGALGVRLEKTGHYYLNAQGREPTADDLRRASWVVGVGVVLAVGAGWLGIRGRVRREATWTSA
jgi:adenosylcobinamide-phosphate synthase